MSMYGVPPGAAPAKKKPGVAGMVVGILVMIIGPVIGLMVVVLGVEGHGTGPATPSPFRADDSQNDFEATKGVEMGLWTSSDYKSGACNIFDPNDTAIEWDASRTSRSWTTSR